MSHEVIVKHFSSNPHQAITSCAWKDPRCRIGLILGTGTNACYLEDIKNIETLDQEDFPGQEHMVINTEWGAFGDRGELDFIKTKWDENVDEMSVNPGKQIYEKMISGMYMGELIRQVLVDLMKDDLIFVGADRERLLERGSFFTRYASEIESDPVGDYTRCRQALEEVGLDPDEVSDDDCSALRYDHDHVLDRVHLVTVQVCVRGSVAQGEHDGKCWDHCSSQEDGLQGCGDCY